eukprot:1838251-Prymnesium_polylepis.1
MQSGSAWVNGVQVANYNLAAANCSVTRMPRCGASPVAASSPDGSCDAASQRYYSVPPEALQPAPADNHILLRETHAAMCCANHAGCK